MWRQHNPFGTYDRVAFNYCCAAAIAKMQADLAAELASYKARYAAWQRGGSLAHLKPKGKEGNCVTRAYAKTGWWPLNKECEMWTKAINTLGPLADPTRHKLADKPHKFANVGDPHIKIRELVLKSYQEDFLDRAHTAEVEYQQRRRRNAARISIENTYGEGIHEGGGYVSCVCLFVY